MSVCRREAWRLEFCVARSRVAPKRMRAAAHFFARREVDACECSEKRSAMRSATRGWNGRRALKYVQNGAEMLSGGASRFARIDGGGGGGGGGSGSGSGGGGQQWRGLQKRSSSAFPLFCSRSPDAAAIRWRPLSHVCSRSSSLCVRAQSQQAGKRAKGRGNERVSITHTPYKCKQRAYCHFELCVRVVVVAATLLACSFLLANDTTTATTTTATITTTTTTATSSNKCARAHRNGGARLLSCERAASPLKARP